MPYVTLPRPILIDPNGSPRVAAKMYVYDAGTTTPHISYTGPDLETEHPNPILSLGNGYFPSVWVDPEGGDYKLTFADANDVPLPVDQDNIPARENFTSEQIAGALDSLAITEAEIAGGVTPVNFAFAPTPYYDMKRYLDMTPGADNTAIIQQVYDMVKTSGGTLVFPPYGDFCFYLDISGPSDRPMVFIEGQHCTFRPHTPTPTNSAVFWCDNSGETGGWADTRLVIRDAFITGQTPAGPESGDLDHCVYLKNAAAKFYNVVFMAAVESGFYGLYCQYTQFWDCIFTVCIHYANSTGCVLDSNGAGESSNEVLFMRPQFLFNQNGLTVAGGAKVRVLSPTVMSHQFGTGTGAINLISDGTGFGCEQITIEDGWFEGNDVPHIRGGTCANVSLSRCLMAQSGHPSVISFATAYNIQANEMCSYGGDCTVTITHPSGDTLDAAVTWQGGNIVPAINIAHGGKSFVDVDVPAKRYRQRENVLDRTAQTGLNSIPLVRAEQFGFKSAVARTVTTNLFSITMEGFATAYEPACVLEVQIHAWQDNAASGDYAYCSRIQRFYVTICNNGGTLQVVGPTSIDSADLSLSSGFRAIGTITLSTSIAGSVVTFRGAYSGSGTDAANITTATMAYTVRSMGANPFTLQRL